MNVGWQTSIAPFAPRRGSPAASGPKLPLAKELIESLRAEFHKLIDGDKFMENLVTIGNLARHAYDLWATLGVAPVASSSTPYGLQLVPDLSYGEQSSVGMAMPMPGMSNPEQFGARSIRELIGLAPELVKTWANANKNTAGAVVDAISKAKSLGMEDLATRLETKLMSMIEGDFEPEEDPEEPEEPHQHAPLPELPPSSLPALSFGAPEFVNGVSP